MLKCISTTSRQFAKIKPFCQTHYAPSMLIGMAGMALSVKPFCFKKQNWNVQDLTRLTTGVIGTTIFATTIGLESCLIIGTMGILFFCGVETWPPKDEFKLLWFNTWTDIKNLEKPEKEDLTGN